MLERKRGGGVVLALGHTVTSVVENTEAYSSKYCHHPLLSSSTHVQNDRRLEDESRHTTHVYEYIVG